MDYESNGMIGARAPLIDGGRLEVYRVDTLDAASWPAPGASLDDRALPTSLRGLDRARVDPVRAPALRRAEEIIGDRLQCRRPSRRELRASPRGSLPLAVCVSGVHDPSELGGGRGRRLLLPEPDDYVANMHGGHLARSAAHDVPHD